MDPCNRKMDQALSMTQSMRRSAANPPVHASRAGGIDFRSIVEASLDVILVHGPDGIPTFVSPSIKQLLGREPEELIGQPHITNVFQEDLPVLMKAVAAHRHGHSDSFATVRMVRKDGTLVWVEGRSRLINDPATGDGSTVVILRDISDRKELEAKLAMMALTGGSNYAAAGKPAKTPSLRPTGDQPGCSAKPRNVN